MNILIVEDDAITAKHLGSLLHSYGFQTTVCHSATDALDAVAATTFDLAVLDINLGSGMDGIQLASVLAHQHQLSFIFLTSYNDGRTINQIIQTRPLGYVSKPFHAVDIHAAVKLALFKSSSQKNVPDTKEPSIYADCIFVKNQRNMERVLISDIDYIEVDGRYTYICFNGQKRISNTPLKSLLSELPSALFVQCHKSFIINLTRIDSIATNTLQLGEKEIPLSKTYRDELFKKIKVV